MANVGWMGVVVGCRLRGAFVNNHSDGDCEFFKMSEDIGNIVLLLSLIIISFSIVRGI